MIGETSVESLESNGINQRSQIDEPCREDAKDKLAKGRVRSPGIKQSRRKQYEPGLYDGGTLCLQVGLRKETCAGNDADLARKDPVECNRASAAAIASGNGDLPLKNHRKSLAMDAQATSPVTGNTGQ